MIDITSDNDIPTQKILLFYQYFWVENTKKMIQWLRDICQAADAQGRIIVAPEGINGTISGNPESMNNLMSQLWDHPELKKMDIKVSYCKGIAFEKLRIMERKEIVHLGIDPHTLPYNKAAAYMTPEEAHAAIAAQDPELVIIDTRNAYESRIGAFEGAIKPPVQTFREFPAYFDEHENLFKNKKVLMYCTGGVRCERASAYLLSKNIAQQVYHIQGGIDRYVEKYPEGFFKGKNYVFDGRVTVPVSDDSLSNCDLCLQAGQDYRNCVYNRCNRQLLLCNNCLSGIERDPLALVCNTECADAIKQHPHTIRTKANRTACHLQQ